MPLRFRIGLPRNDLHPSLIHGSARVGTGLRDHPLTTYVS